MKIAGREIVATERPYIVAEISGNHMGSLDLAKRLIRLAKQSGADAVKTQCYEPDTITLDINKPDFIVQEGLWRGRKLYDLYKEAHTPFAWHKELYQVARDEGITIFSSVFDKSSVDLLERLGCPAYKIASFEITDTPLIQYAAQTNKPLIISTGLANDREVLEADAASDFKAAFLHCTSDYPATVERANLGRMRDLDKLLGYKSPIGISDHTISLAIPVAATVLKGTIIEKHLRDNDPGSEDDAFSLRPREFSEMVTTVAEVFMAISKVPKEYTSAPRQLRRSIYVVQDIKAGEKFSEKNIRSIRPAYGLAPKKLHDVLGRVAKRDYRRGDPLVL